MAICLNCGKETDYCLCEDCRGGVDIEALCQKVIEYRPGSGENPLWDQVASEMANTRDFRSIVFALADELRTPRREYWKILSFSGESANVQKYNRPWLYETYGRIKDLEGLSRQEMNRIKGMVLGALFMDYRYDEADLVAAELLEEVTLPKQAYYNLADFYSKTRRYDEADDAMNAATKLYGAEQTAVLFGKLAESNRGYREKEAQGKQQYLPNPKEAKKAYIDYLNSIGIEVTPKSSIPKAIPIDVFVK